MQRELEQKTAKRRAKRLKRKVCCRVHHPELSANSMASPSIQWISSG